MRQRPFALFVSACLFLYFPVELLYRWYAENMAVDAVDIALSVVLPLFLIVGLVRVTVVSWYTLVAMVALWGVRDLHDFYASQGASSVTFLLHVAIYALSLGYFINPRIRRVYFDPQLRWWRSKPRHETHLPFLFSHQDSFHYPILRNLSEGGCFIEMANPLGMTSLLKIAIPLPIPLNVSVIKAEGEVRWVSTNPLRTGMGVRFTHLGKSEIKAIKEFIRQQL